MPRIQNVLTKIFLIKKNINYSFNIKHHYNMKIPDARDMHFFFKKLKS